MRIGLLADRLGLNPKTIRYYESIGLLPEPCRTASGYRDYDDEDLTRLRFIKSAQRLGVTLDKIREILALRENGQRPCGYVQRMLRDELGDIDRKISELQQLREELVELVALAEQAPPDVAPVTCPLIEHVRRHGERETATPSGQEPSGPYPPTGRLPEHSLGADLRPQRPPSLGTPAPPAGTPQRTRSSAPGHTPPRTARTPPRTPDTAPRRTASPARAAARRRRTMTGSPDTFVRTVRGRHSLGWCSPSHTPRRLRRSH